MKIKRRNKKSPKPLKVVSLFSGAMGLDLGLERAGFQLSVAIECDPVAVETIKKNRPRHKVIAKRIESVPTSEIRKIGKLKRGDTLVVVGGPSCQAFSTAGQRLSLGDPRGNLFREFIRVVRELRPHFFIMENVRGLLSAAVRHRPLAKRGPGNPRLQRSEELGSAFTRVTAAFRRLGYYVSFDLLNAADYGVPQVRERLVFIGSKNGEPIVFPPPTHSRDGSNGFPSWLTLKDAIGDMKMQKQEFKNFLPTKQSLLARIPKGGNWRNLPKRLQAKAIGGAYRSWGGRSGFLRRLAWEKPSPSLVTLPDGNATCLCHPTKIRPLSIEEYARIQQFPANWKFSGSTNQKYRQIGNAVPLGLGAVLGQAVKLSIQKKPRKQYRGIIECASAGLLRKLKNTKRTYLNPPAMRKVTKAGAVSSWFKGAPRKRKEVLVFATRELRAALARLRRGSKQSSRAAVAAL